jgi:hypothetical protein
MKIIIPILLACLAMSTQARVRGNKGRELDEADELPEVPRHLTGSMKSKKYPKYPHRPPGGGPVIPSGAPGCNNSNRRCPYAQICRGFYRGTGRCVPDVAICARRNNCPRRYRGCGARCENGYYCWWDANGQDYCVWRGGGGVVPSADRCENVRCGWCRRCVNGSCRVDNTNSPRDREMVCRNGVLCYEPTDRPRCPRCNWCSRCVNGVCRRDDGRAPDDRDWRCRNGVLIYFEN